MTALNGPRVDLHTHSTASDGILTPAALVSRAAAEGVTCLSLTDHDTVAGLAEAAQASRECGIRFVNGVEISSSWEGREIHVVGLAFDSRQPCLQAFLDSQGERRRVRAEKIAQRLEEKGLQQAWEKVQAMVGAGLPGRGHFARLLVSEGWVQRPEQAFRKWLTKGRYGHVPVCWPSLEMTVEAIRSAGGKAVLAHPLSYGFSRKKLRTLVQAFVAAGGQGIEQATRQARPAEQQWLWQFAREFELQISAGSDFHSPSQQWITLGQLPAIPDDLTPIWRDFTH